MTHGAAIHDTLVEPFDHRVRPSAFSIGLVLLSSGLASAQHPEDDQSQQIIYRYINKQGRPVFTNGLQQVPFAHRGRAEAMDLSRAFVAPMLRRAIEQSVQEQEQALASADLCVRARGVESKPWWVTLHEDHGHLLAIGGVMVLLLLATPFVLRVMDVPTWARPVTGSLQILAVVGLLTHGVVSARKSYARLAFLSEPCAQLTAHRPPASQSGALFDRLSVINHVRATMAAFQAERALQHGRALDSH
ncbi:MAG: hypothetical protein MJD61_18395 [Proteobacteria bacterium]|nr:hypothetical protein [Pseudomonadota bacterium]